MLVSEVLCNAILWIHRAGIITVSFAALPISWSLQKEAENILFSVITGWSSTTCTEKLNIKAVSDLAITQAPTVPCAQHTDHLRKLAFEPLVLHSSLSTVIRFNPLAVSWAIPWHPKPIPTCTAEGAAAAQLGLKRPRAVGGVRSYTKLKGPLSFPLSYHLHLNLTLTDLWGSCEGYPKQNGFKASQSYNSYWKT